MINLRSKTAKRREWARQTRVQLAFERGLSSKLRNEFKRVGDVVESHIKGGHVDVEPIVRAHEAHLSRILRPYYMAAYKTFSKMLNEHAPAVGKQRELKAMSEDDINQFAAEFTAEWVPKRVSNISKVTAQKITDTINKGREEEWTDAQTAKEIRTRVSGIGGSRAKTIARTESHSSSMAGSFEAAQNLGVDNLRKEWLTVEDDRVRDDHAELQGEIVDMNDSFDVGGDELDYPGDPSGSPEETINCRCVLTYTTEQ